MEFIHHAKLMRHRKYIFECVRFIRGIATVGLKIQGLLDSLVMESGTS